MKTTELEGPHLDWAVAKAMGLTPIPNQPAGFFYWDDSSGRFAPSTDWSQGGPIIDREKIGLEYHIIQGHWLADSAEYWEPLQGPTPLISAMRAFVASKLGDTVEVPV